MKRISSLVFLLLTTIALSAQVYNVGNITITQSDIQNAFNSINSIPVTSINSNVRYQSGYFRSNGTHVKGHWKTKSNNTNIDNFSTIGNINIFTGNSGNVPQDYSINALNYGSGKTIHTGPRGGQYYINSNGNKTYVPKRSKKSIWDL